MPRIFTATMIRKPAETVYEYVTTPGNWPRWHPSSLAVTGATNHSLQVGEQVTEEYLVAGRLGRAVWTVAERDAPHHWTIEGAVAGTKHGGRVRYTLYPQASGDTFFERELWYEFSNPFHRILDAWFIRRRLQRESAEALARLKARLEELGDSERSTTGAG